VFGAWVCAIVGDIAMKATNAGAITLRSFARLVIGNLV
jgi:hypothetical protein